MKRFSLVLFLAAACMLFGGPSTPQAGDQGGLDAALKKMDAVAAGFHSAQANFEWDIYQKVIDEVDEVETGTIYSRRNSKDLEMMAEIKKTGGSLAALKPEPKYVLFSGGKVRVYQPKIDQVQEFDLGKNHSEYENYLVLGLGGSGQDLQKSFDVSYVGPQTVDKKEMAELQLIPKSDKVKNTYNKILLWIDLERGISVQQKFFSPDGNYKLVKYSDVQINGKKIPDDVFKLKTTGKTQVVSPRG